jgi:hypothetical protein
MNILDRARILRATVSYDLWLDLAGMPGRRRRDLRWELGVNLGDATHSSDQRMPSEAWAAHERWPQQQTRQISRARVGRWDSRPA